MIKKSKEEDTRDTKDTRTTSMISHRSGVLFLNFQLVSHIALEFPLLALNKQVLNSCSTTLYTFQRTSHYHPYTCFILPFNLKVTCKVSID